MVVDAVELRRGVRVAGDRSRATPAWGPVEVVAGVAALAVSGVRVARGGRYLYLEVVKMQTRRVVLGDCDCGYALPSVA